ncbi:carboxypeptidase-like regulatory domain-containing protein [Archangium sp.]|jgi:hypothetical protein|uniref:carboxypeptidase-like regulatory domain-containing protein n=1 Tax=Archangium sp. TaxID=1872627 RepID=UPI00389AF74B
MLRARQPLLFLGLALLASCDGGVRVQRQGDPCTDSLVTLRVEVLDAQGATVKDATVTATNVDTGHTITSTTSDRGVTTAVNEDIGEGTVRLTATAGSKVSAPAEVHWTCDDCHCHPEPATVQLQLHP